MEKIKKRKMKNNKNTKNELYVPLKIPKHCRVKMKAKIPKLQIKLEDIPNNIKNLVTLETFLNFLIYAFNKCSVYVKLKADKKFCKFILKQLNNIKTKTISHCKQ